MNAIQCHAPTNDSDEADKYQFYERLQQIVEKFFGKYLTVLMEDLNAKIGKDNTGH